MIQIVQSGDQNDKEGMVKVGKLKTVISAGQTKEVRWTVRTGPLSSKQDVLFEPEEIQKWPEGLNITETLTCLQKGTGLRLLSQSLMSAAMTLCLPPTQCQDIYS